ncbi:MAG: hypothetical protein K6U09_10735 [Acidobacteriia bacterium]|jgi:hypothetical protein|nr:hypothetical protein [Terriglobia bacterium]
MTGTLVHVLAVLARLLVGSVLVFAAITKLGRFDRFVRAVAGYRLLTECAVHSVS